MLIRFEGFSLTAGVFIVSGANDTLTRASVGGAPCTLKSTVCFGLSIYPFSVMLDCPDDQDCVPQSGDWIRVTSRTILFVDITTYKWSLCGGKCGGSKTSLGLALGAGITFARWEVP